ncbi:hypothetical protein Btru_061658 [Bulinus truncatus]|nr:hypothetical protein Btru_061658 [Bulinus truncatus]
MIVVVITLLAVGSLFGGSPGVDGASCTTAGTCQSTDFTLPSCTSNVCNCINSSFTPIRTGCALRLDKPVITPTAGRSNQVIAGQTFTLTCVVSGASTYEWYFGSSKLSETGLTFTPTAASATNVGSFTCKGLTSDPALISDPSDPFKVELLGTGGLTTSSVQPTIYVPTTTSLTGKDVGVVCSNLPMGYTDTITYKVAGATVTTNTITLDNTNAGKDVTCTMTTPSTSVTFSNPTSAAGKLPTIITNIQSVTVTYNGIILAEVADHLTTPTLTLTCSYSPDDMYLSGTPTFAWQKDNVDIPSKTGVTYSPDVEGTYLISCSTTLGSLTKVSSSNKVKVTISNTYIDAPKLTSSATSPIKGGRVILTCGDTRTDTVTYSWKIGTTPIDRQYDRKLQIDNFDTADNGVYSCAISKNLFTATSNSITLTVQTTIATPVIYVSGCGTLLAEKGDYWLACQTDSESIGMTYVWTVGGTQSSVTSKYYSLPAISISNNGDYICAAKFGSVTSSNSSAKTVVVTDPGMLCYHDNVCIAARTSYTGYTGTCDANDRCLCSDGYTAKGEQCINGVTTILGSIFLVLSTCFITRFI